MRNKHAKQSPLSHSDATSPGSDSPLAPETEIPNQDVPNQYQDVPNLKGQPHKMEHDLLGMMNE